MPAEIWRFPVTSCGGEVVPAAEAEVDVDGTHAGAGAYATVVTPGTIITAA